MSAHNETVPTFSKPDYQYGNRSPIEIIYLKSNLGNAALDPHGSLDHDTESHIFFTEAELEDKVTELADNYQIIGDPKSTEANPKQFGITILNAHLIDRGVPAIITISTSGSNLYDEKGNSNNEGNALETAYIALKHNNPVVYIEAPGNGNSVDLEKDEYKQAMQDGKLVVESTDNAGKIVDFEAIETMQALARALTHVNINAGYVSSKASGAHFSSGLYAALPKDTLMGALLYNPTNISDRNNMALMYGNIKEIVTQGRYAKVSNDHLILTDERKKMARRVMGSVTKRKIDQMRASTHNPSKLSRQHKIFSRGNENGAAAAVHNVVGQMRHKNLKQTIVFPEFAAQYKNPRDFERYMELVGILGGSATQNGDLESLKIPMGQYGHSHYPTLITTLEGYAFNR